MALNRLLTREVLHMDDAVDVFLRASMAREPIGRIWNASSLLARS